MQSTKAVSTELRTAALDLCVADASQAESDAEMRREKSFQIQATGQISHEYNTGLVVAQIWEL